MYLNFVDPKIEIFCDRQEFILRPISKNKNSEIMEIHEKPQNTEIKECNSKTPLNTVKMTFSK